MSRINHLVIFTLLLAKNISSQYLHFEKMFYRIYSLGSYETIMPQNPF